MVDEQRILAVERLRDDLEDLKKELRQRYSGPTRQVTSEAITKRAARIAEIWLVESATDVEVVGVIGSEIAANLSVHFQRLLTFAEHATTRGKYEAEIKAIVKSFTMDVVLPLKRARGTQRSTPIAAKVHEPDPGGEDTSVFIGQSFAKEDEYVNSVVRGVLEAIGITVVTGERPRANTISQKVKGLIEEQAIFLGIFTRRDKVARKQEWTTSSWVIDEKAYALGRQKRLILLKEQGVGSIGGIQGDYEYLEFTRLDLTQVLLRLIQMFSVQTSGLRK